MMAAADGLCAGGTPAARLRNFQRVVRRTINRCWRDRAIIAAPRVFCQNSGGCGSTYIVKLLQANGVSNCFHEKTPDLNSLGVEYFESGGSSHRIRRLLRYTRHDVLFEASNRLFSLSRELKCAFPSARFIHLHRHAADAVRSAMSKPDIERYLATSPRFAGLLGGPKTASPFERFCHYWANINGRILDDLDSLDLPESARLSMTFEDLTSGNIGSLQRFVNSELNVRKLPPANVGKTGIRGRFEAYEDWTFSQKSTFHRICGDVLARLGYDEYPRVEKTAQQQNKSA